MEFSNFNAWTLFSYEFTNHAQSKYTSWRIRKIFQYQLAKQLWFSSFSCQRGIQYADRDVLLKVGSIQSVSEKRLRIMNWKLILVLLNESSLLFIWDSDFKHINWKETSSVKSQQRFSEFVPFRKGILCGTTELFYLISDLVNYFGSINIERKPVISPHTCK